MSIPRYYGHTKRRSKSRRSKARRRSSPRRSGRRSSSKGSSSSGGGISLPIVGKVPTMLLLVAAAGLGYFFLMRKPHAKATNAAIAQGKTPITPDQAAALASAAATAAGASPADAAATANTASATVSSANDAGVAVNADGTVTGADGTTVDPNAGTDPTTAALISDTGTSGLGYLAGWR